MNIELIKAILHVLDPAVDAPILSEAILPPSEDALQYLAGHAAKCFASDEAKACTLADDSAFLPLLWNIEDDFEKKTAVIAGDWFRVMQENPAIPAGDAAFLLLEIDGAEYLAALKLNYKPGWLHYCRMDGGPAVNEVVRQGTVLPGTSGKADEAFFVDLRTNAVRQLEKKYEIDGRTQTYLGSRILGCRAGLSPRAGARHGCVRGILCGPRGGKIQGGQAGPRSRAGDLRQAVRRYAPRAGGFHQGSGRA